MRDYELQVSLSEALCRLTPRRGRQQRASEWFSPDISSAFYNIIDRDFEVDCRRFLNFVNCHQGNKRRVYTFPCLTAFLDSTEVLLLLSGPTQVSPIADHEKGEDSLHVKDTGKKAETTHPKKILDDRPYNRKTPKVKSQLKSILVGTELDISQEHKEELEGSGSALQQEVFTTDRRRASDSGYLESPTEGTPAQKRKVDCQLEREESVVMTDCSPAEAGPSAQDEGLICEGVESYEKEEEPVNEPGVKALLDLTTGITAAFKTFKTQLEEHFNRIEKSITDPLTQLTILDTMDTEMLSFFQSELQRVSCFCDERLQRLKCLEKGESENPSSQ
ncbi:hypothetical protein INR49_029205 [Caranx melampygus]|nr:hypothetical protein INR49_029205 [Caranx melampygus]